MERNIQPALRSQLLESYAKQFALPHKYVQRLEGFFVDEFLFSGFDLNYRYEIIGGVKNAGDLN